MKERIEQKILYPIVDEKEIATLDTLTEQYNKLIEPNKIVKLGKKVIEHIPEEVKTIGKNIGLSLEEQELYSTIMDIVGNGFQALEEQAARFSISETYILKKINCLPQHYKLNSIEEICLARSYDLEKIVSSYMGQDNIAALIEGATTGAFGFWGLPFNIALSTFLFFRAVQSIAMFYGYDTKHNSTELVIANEVFTNALSPANAGTTNEATSIIGKIIVMSQAATIKQTATKSWTSMVEHQGIPLLLTQLRALANKSAQKALQKAGEKGLEHSLFKETFEQIGRKLTLKTISKAVPVVSAALGGLIDVSQMKKILMYSNIFYQKRFILEKGHRIYLLTESDSHIIKDSNVIADESSCEI